MPIHSSIWQDAAVSYLLVLNVLAFFLMGFDKRQAKSGGRRVPERTLFLAAALGGSVGAIAGMRSFHHKTRHWYFVWGLPAILAVHVVLLMLVAHFSGFN